MYSISEELGNKIYTYLETKPYKEVHELIKGLETLVRVTILPQGGDSSVQSTETKSEESNGSLPETGGESNNDQKQESSDQ